MHGQDSDDDDEDGASDSGEPGRDGPVIDYALDRAAGQHRELGPEATSYFNALLAAKNSAQPVVICRESGAGPRCCLRCCCCRRTTRAPASSCYTILFEYATTRMYGSVQSVQRAGGSFLM
jgi:hypothetical protein